MATPGSLYTASIRSYPERLPQLTYASGDEVRYVDAAGKFRWNGLKVWLSKVLAEQVIGLQVLDQAASEDYWRVRFGPVEIGVLDPRRGRLLRPREQRHLLAEKPTR